ESTFPQGVSPPQDVDFDFFRTEFEDWVQQDYQQIKLEYMEKEFSKIQNSLEIFIPDDVTELIEKEITVLPSREIDTTQKQQELDELIYKIILFSKEKGKESVEKEEKQTTIPEHLKSEAI